MVDLLLEQGSVPGLELPPSLRALAHTPGIWHQSRSGAGPRSQETGGKEGQNTKSKDRGVPCCSSGAPSTPALGKSPLTWPLSCCWDPCTKPVTKGAGRFQNSPVLTLAVSTFLSVHRFPSSESPVPNTHSTLPPRSTLISLLLTPATSALVLRGTLVLVSRICRAGSLQ